MSKIIWITGISGVGKTSLAKHYLNFLTTMYGLMATSLENYSKMTLNIALKIEIKMLKD